MLNTKGLVALTEIKTRITKITKDIESNLVLLFNEIYSFTNNFWLWTTIDWIHKNKIVVATILKGW